MPLSTDRQVLPIAARKGMGSINRRKTPLERCLGDAAMSGNPGAREALIRLLRAPDLHPLLLEMAAAVLDAPAG
jgi:hypothetical protein